MAGQENLVNFVRDALVAGRNRSDISAALVDAGWSEPEAVEALGAFADTSFNPPVPRPRPIVSARDFFIYVLLFGTMLASTTSLTVLVFDLIDIVMSDSTSGWRVRSARSTLAVILVTAPMFAWLHRREMKRLSASASRGRSAIRKWATYVSLLIASGAFAINLIVALSALLNGDITLIFVLRIMTVAIVSGSVFLFYRSDVAEEAP